MLKKYEAASEQVNLTRAFMARSTVRKYLNRQTSFFIQNFPA